jgi:hypothetical protein
MLTIMHWQEQSAFFSFMYALMGTYLFFAVLSKTRAKMQYFINTNLMIPTLWRNPLWALHQRPLSEFSTWIIINIDQLHQLAHCWYGYLSYIGHLYSIHHQWQMTAKLSNSYIQQQNNSGNWVNGLFLNSRYRLWSIWNWYTSKHTAGTNTCPSSVSLTTFITSDNGWPMGQIWTCNS